MRGPNETTNILSRPKKRKNKSNYCVKKKNNYCCVCCKYFTTKSSHLHHMSTYHDETETFKIPCTNKLVFKSTYKTTNKKYWLDPTDIFMEYFENEMCTEFKKGNDEFRCFICHQHFANITEYLMHEIIHYRESNNNKNVHVDHEINNSKIICHLCLCTFTSKPDFDNHRNKYCKHDINDKNSLKFKNIFKKENEEQQNKSEVKFELVPQSFNCFVCKQMCDRLDHWEVYEWWSDFESRDNFKINVCYVCQEVFSENEKFKMHEMDHIKNIC